MAKPLRLDIPSKDEYFFAPPGDDTPWVMRCAREHWGPAFVQHRQLGSRHFIALIQQGTCHVIHQGGQRETIGPGAIMYLSGHDEIRLETGPEGCHHVLFLLDQKNSPALTTRLPTRSGCLPLNDPGRVESLLMRLLEVGEKRGLHSSEIASSLALPLILTIDQEYRSHKEAPDPVFAQFMRCRNAIDHQWRTISSVNDVPQAMGISQPYMARLFQRFEQCTPHQYLLKQKMTHALYALQQPDMTVAEIAQDLGFSDAYSFSKSFKRVMGQSPTAMRN